MIYGSKEDILQRIGNVIRSERLQQNITQRVLAARSGVSLNAVKNIESGAGATLGTFVLVCRTLGKDSWISSFSSVNDEISPIEYAENLQKAKRRIRLRAGSKHRK